MYTTDRKSSYKLPPTTIRDKLISQETRRSKALEEQKRRRAQKVDSSRQLDLFADLSLAELSDDEPESRPGLAPTSVAAYVSLLQTAAQGDSKVVAHEFNMVASSSSLHAIPQNIPEENVHNPSEESTENTKKPRKRGGKNSHKRRAEANKASNSTKYKGGSKWADKCMYAELLEMNGDEAWGAAHSRGYGEEIHDGLPRDLESGWVAVAPVPKGKRCLVVTQQSAGVAGVVPNTTLRSRLLGKYLLPRFPSTLPPLTVLDCILDESWRDNGVLHVLDVVRWKGQDVADCEAGFRFWWRDTRLAELPKTPPPSFHFISPVPTPSAFNTSNAHPPITNDPAIQIPQPTRYHFPYPTTFIPIPYHSSTTLTSLDTQIIPAARSLREVPIILPSLILGTLLSPSRGGAAGGEMEIESSSLPVNPPAESGIDTTLMPTTALVQPDGLLLYVAEASYEPGTSPLSSWIPIRGYDDDAVQNGGVDPLDLFQRLVRKRLNRQNLVESQITSNLEKISRSSYGAKNTIITDVEMELE